MRASCQLYRGYPVEQLAEKSSFLRGGEDLLINGTLPTKTGAVRVSGISITRHTMVNEQLLRFFQGFHHRRAPHGHGLRGEGGLHGGVLSGLDRHRRSAAARNIFASDHREAADHRRGHRRHYRAHRSASRSSIRATICATAPTCSTCFSLAMPCETRMPSIRSLLKHLDLLFILHADHEQNASFTSTVRTGRQHRRESVCGDFRRCIRALGTGARRRQ